MTAWHWRKRDRKSFRSRSEILADQERKRIEDQQRQIESWVRQSLEQIDSQGMMDLYSLTAKSVQQGVVRLAVESLALVEGVSQANAAIKNGLNMEGVSISIADATTLVDMLLRVRVCRLMLENCGLKSDYKQMIFRRFIARLLPRRDNVAASPSIITQPRPKVQTRLSEHGKAARGMSGGGFGGPLQGVIK